MGFVKGWIAIAGLVWLGLKGKISWSMVSLLYLNETRLEYEAASVRRNEYGSSGTKIKFQLGGA